MLGSEIDSCWMGDATARRVLISRGKLVATRPHENTWGGGVPFWGILSSLVLLLFLPLLFVQPANTSGLLLEFRQIPSYLDWFSFGHVFLSIYACILQSNP